jgi:hypothetical protein
MGEMSVTRHQNLTDLSVFDGPGVDLAKQFAEINARIWDQLARHQLAAMALQLDAGVNQLRLFGQAQTLNDIIAGQTQLAQEYAERVMAYSRRIVTAADGLTREDRAHALAVADEAPADTPAKTIAPAATVPKS